MAKINIETTITCPSCGSKYQQKMPRKSKHINHKCVLCHTVFGISDITECCVYCAYSNELCPQAQKQKNKKS
jgi:hypothetical protein